MVRRSREGAWIEMALRKELDNNPAVAPARERGLKYEYTEPITNATYGRSREGAWIEIVC